MAYKTSRDSQLDNHVAWMDDLQSHLTNVTTTTTTQHDLLRAEIKDLRAGDATPGSPSAVSNGGHSVLQEDVPTVITAN